MLGRLFAVALIGGGLAAALAAEDRPKADAPNRGNQAADTPRDANAPRAADARRDAAKHAFRAHRASGLTGMDVRNAAGENLGNIQDLVIDMNTGEVRYAALSFGGFLGIGDKLFAVPWHDLRMVHEEDDTFFVLSVDKERLKDAPGFDKDTWPNFADENWAKDIDKFYAKPVPERRLDRTDNLND
jgi:sporulation protein YlmC with PRC-barrel domain